MLIWSQDGSFFVCLEQHQCVRIGKEQDAFDGSKCYTVCADDRILGVVDTIEKAKGILNKIAFNYKISVAECDPW